MRGMRARLRYNQPPFPGDPFEWTEEQYAMIAALHEIDNPSTGYIQNFSESEQEVNYARAIGDR